MRLKTISATNFKGQSFRHELAPVTLFHGRNWRGKSARLEAVQWLLSGCVPAIARKPNELFERLASGNPMQVVGDFDDGKSWQRVLKQIGGSVKYAGNSETFPTSLVDPQEFLGLSGPAQTRFLFGLATLGEDSGIKAMGTRVVAEVKGVKLEEHSKETEEEIDTLCSWMCNETRDLVRMPQEWLANLAEQLRLKKNAAVAEVDRMAKTGQGLAQVGSQAAVPADAEAQWQKAKAASEQASVEVAKCQAQRDSVAKEWKAAKAALDACESVDTMKLRSEREDAEAKLAKWTRDMPETDFRTAAEIEPDLSKAQSAVNLTTVAENSLRDRLDRCGGEIQSAEQATDCPTCGHKFTTAEKKKTVANLNRELKAIRLDLAIAKQRSDVASDELERLTKLQAEAREREKLAGDLSKAMEQARTHIAQIDAKLAAVGNLEQLRQGMKRVEADGKDVSSRLICATDKQRDCATKAKAAEDGYKALLAQRAEAKGKADAATAMRRAKAGAEVLKKACAIVADLQAELVGKTVGPLVDTVNNLCNDLLPARVEYREGDLVSLDQKSGGWYGYRTFSGTQRKVFYAGLCVALAAKSPFKLALVDEVDIDDGNLDRLLGRLCELQRIGVLDQAIVASTRKPTDFEVPGALECIEV